MHLTLLSRGSAIHTTHRLVEAARRLGHRARVVDPLALQMELGPGGARLHLEHRPLGRTDVVIPRIGQSITEYGLAVVNHLGSTGVPVLNDAASIQRVRNKMQLMQLLARHGLAVPPTVMGSGAAALGNLVELVGGLPVVIRLVQGPGGAGVIVCESRQSLDAALEAVLAIGQNLIVQRYPGRAEGRDLRALVVGGRVLAAVRRQPRPGRLHHSLGAGARVSAVTLSREQALLAAEAARVSGLEVAAVDLLDLKRDGPRVFEIHASPGLQALEAATGEDLAQPIVRRAVELARLRRAAARALGKGGNGARERPS